MLYTVFDFEFTQLIPELGNPWPSELKISCGSLLSTGDIFPQVWYEKVTCGTDEIGDHMSESTLSDFVDELIRRTSNGHAIVTWGGSATDWRMLHKECPQRSDSIKSLALNSIDIPMCSCVTIGMMMGLNSACRALGYDLKADASSHDMPRLWLENRPKVLQHVSNDSFATMVVLKQAEITGMLPWLTSKGTIKVWNAKFLTVSDCLKMDLPVVPFKILPHFNAKLLARWLLLGTD